MPENTLRSWVSGATRASELHLPVARPVKPPVRAGDRLADLTNSRLSFSNLTEAHVLDALRRQYQVELPQIRRAVSYLREHFRSPHPLVHHEMLTDGKHLFVRAQPRPQGCDQCISRNVPGGLVGESPVPPRPLTSTRRRSGSIRSVSTPRSCATSSTAHGQLRRCRSRAHSGRLEEPAARGVGLQRWIRAGEAAARVCGDYICRRRASKRPACPRGIGRGEPAMPRACAPTGPRRTGPVPRRRHAISL